MDKKTTEYYLHCGIAKRWHNLTLDDFVNDPKALTKVKNYLGNIDEALKDGVGLYLYGSNGTGKSMLMNTMFMEIIKKRKTVSVLSIDELVTRVTSSWYSKNEEEDFSAFRRADFFGIDEFGKNLDKDGNPKPIPELVKRIVESTIRYRVQMCKPICIASNTDVKYVEKVFSEDIASLLNEAVLPVRVTGEDYRKKIQIKMKDKYL